MATPAPANAQPQPASEEELNLAQLLQSLQRRWPLIALGGLCGLAMATWVNNTSKPIWMGEFQIVLSSDKGSGASGNLGQILGNSPLLGLSGLAGGGGKDSLETQVKILESPSVLKPVFEQVKRQKAARSPGSSQLRFSNWSRGNLSIKLEKNTSVLNINYRDTDKHLILPVMQQISQAYQEYSGRDRSRSLDNALAYTQAQVEKFRSKATASSRALDAFRIRYGITANGSSGAGSGIDLSKLLSSNQNSGLDITSSALANAGGSGGGSQFANAGDAFGQLESINQELIRRRQTFTERDPIIQGLLRERAALRRHLEITAGGNLTLPGTKPASKEEAQDILLRFKELERQADRDDSTLNSLESTLLSLQLEKARATQPWELISTPTLLDDPISPRPARNLMLGLLAGLLAGSGTAVLVDRRSGLIFHLDELQQELPGPLLAELHGTNDPTLQLVAQGPLAGASTVGLIPLGLASGDPQLRALQQQLQQLLPDSAIVPCADGVSSSTCSHCLLVTQLGVASRAQLKRLRQQLHLHPQPLTGWLLLDAGHHA